MTYNPPLRALAKGTVLTPVARNAAATWLQVQVQETGERGWVSAGAPYVRWHCPYCPIGHGDCIGHHQSPSADRAGDSWSQYADAITHWGC